MPEKRPAPKGFRLDQQTRERLARLAEELQCSEADVIRSSLTALDGLLRHGLKDWTLEQADGKRVIHLPQAPARTLMLVESGEGGFAPWAPYPKAALWTDAPDSEGDTK